MEQGIIRALKAKYHSLAFRKLILALRKKAIYMLKKVWDA